MNPTLEMVMCVLLPENDFNVSIRQIQRFVLPKVFRRYIDIRTTNRTLYNSIAHFNENLL